MGGDKEQPGKKKDPLRDTLNLPRTDFAMKANLLQMEPRFQARWQTLGLHERLRRAPHPAGPFVFHDGPPYANGHIHMGHLLNKVLKDLVVRSRGMLGHDVHFVPGWDCHGLPIEHQVMKDLGERARELQTMQIRHRCKQYAEKFIDIQRKQMQRLGTVADYERPYLTMLPRYESDVLEVFAGLVERGLVYRDLKPVHWSIANQTALAEAELEYADREDVSVYVNFEVVDAASLPAALGAPKGQRVHLMIWTTTPWTLPANLAVAVSPSQSYGLYKYEKGGGTAFSILASALAEKVLGQGGATDVVCLGTCAGNALSAVRYRHPFIDRVSPVTTADYVTMEDGTGLVHTAPGHGVEDYQTGQRLGLPTYCPVKGDGTFDDTAPEWLRGVDVWKGNAEVVQRLRQSGHLFFDHRFSHSYPHDWRSKTPTIFRATEQWFVAVDKPAKGLGRSLRELALDAVDHKVSFVPSWGQSRMRGMLEARPDWCISRQRAWGLPIPAFLADGEEALLTARSVRAVAAVFARAGSDAWFRGSPAELLAGYDPAGDPDAPAWLRAAGKAGLARLRCAADIFDVWFESGSSWNAVLRARGLGYPAELYLEGSDQHRGWFQLSLLPALGVTGEPPFRALLTHGFIVDAQGRKMSKSLGNAIDVDELLKKHGADVCRWWVLSLNFANDIRADWSFFEAASEDYRKVRNTLRFLLGNLFDFDPRVHRYLFSEDDAHSIDAWALSQLDAVVAEATDAYATFQYRRIRDAVFNFCNETLSAVYMAAIKDRLYCERPESPKRRRTQTALYEIADALIRLLAPVLSHTADEAYLSLRKLPLEAEACVHLEALPRSLGRVAAEGWVEAMALRHEVLKAFEAAKAAQGVANPLDVEARVTVPAAEHARLAPFVAELADLCGMSRFELRQGPALAVEIVDLRAEPRCERSWKRDGTVKQRANGHVLSDRDADAYDASAAGKGAV